jgi:hypothetical protein
MALILERCGGEQILRGDQRSALAPASRLRAWRDAPLRRHSMAALNISSSLNIVRKTAMDGERRSRMARDIEAAHRRMCVWACARRGSQFPAKARESAGVHLPRFGFGTHVITRLAVNKLLPTSSKDGVVISDQYGQRTRRAPLQAMPTRALHRNSRLVIVSSLDLYEFTKPPARLPVCNHTEKNYKYTHLQRPSGRAIKVHRRYLANG